jgi:hypothetical protein
MAPARPELFSLFVLSRLPVCTLLRFSSSVAALTRIVESFCSEANESTQGVRARRGGSHGMQGPAMQQ